jgi:hypothetical protein
MRLGCDIGQHLNGGRLEGNGGKSGGEFGLSGLHESGVIGAGDIQWQGFPGATCFGEITGLVNAICFAGDDNLAGAIEIGEVDSGGCADSTGGFFLESNDGGHGALGDVAGFLHEPATLPHEFKSNGERHDARGSEGGEFTQGQAGSGMEGEFREARAQQFEGNPTDEINARLCMLGACQLIFGTIEAETCEVISKQLVGLVKEGSGSGKMVGQILTHADGLGTLPSEEERGLFHTSGHCRDKEVCREVE